MKKWRVDDSRIVFDAAPWVTVKQERCVLPDGTVIPDYNIIDAPDIVIIFALTSNRQVVLVEQYKHGVQEILLELPGGLIEDESPLASARRELREETGYDSDQWQTGMTTFHNPTREKTRIYHFIATDVQQVAEQNLDATEDIDVRLLSIDHVLKALNDGQIASVHSVAAIYHSLRLLGHSG